MRWVAVLSLLALVLSGCASPTAREGSTRLGAVASWTGTEPLEGAGTIIRTALLYPSATNESVLLAANMRLDGIDFDTTDPAYAFTQMFLTVAPEPQGKAPDRLWLAGSHERAYGQDRGEVSVRRNGSYVVGPALPTASGYTAGAGSSSSARSIEIDQPLELVVVFAFSLPAAMKDVTASWSLNVTSNESLIVPQTRTAARGPQAAGYRFYDPNRAEPGSAEVTVRTRGATLSRAEAVSFRFATLNDTYLNVWGFKDEGMVASVAARNSNGFQKEHEFREAGERGWFLLRHSSCRGESWNVDFAQTGLGNYHLWLFYADVPTAPTDQRPESRGPCESRMPKVSVF